MKEDCSHDSRVDRANLPGHVAIIMDGNGRWARARGWARTRGHEAGADSVRAVGRMCGRLGISQLTLFAFSSENWKRPKREVSFLMRLLRDFLISERPSIVSNNVRVRAIGRIAGLPQEVQDELARTIEMTAANTGLLLRLALNYGGRQEIVDAARAFAEKCLRGQAAPEDLDVDAFRRFLYDADMTDPDLLIRTGGEMRVSNFLLWEMAYTEIYVASTCWPDFREAEFAKALEAYAGRERRYGGLPRRSPRRQTGAHVRVS